jgi:hypothetical protein
MKTIFASALLAAVSVATADVNFTSMGTFNLKNAAFPSVASFGDAPEDKFLLVSSFGALSSGAVYVVPSIKAAIVNKTVSQLKPVSLPLHRTNFQWPNDVKVVPFDVFGQRAIVVPDGFLVPGKTNGGVYIITMDPSNITLTTSVTKISTEPKGYFYHMGEWVDMNGDGRKDFVTARSNAKAGGGQLVWFEHPAEGISGEWTEHVVTSGPDVGIQVIKAPQYPNEIVVFAAEFFNEKVSVHRVSTVDGTLVQSKEIDVGTILHAYSVTYADINGDGVKELIVNNHEKDNKTNGIWAYTLPSDWMTGTYTKTTLSSNFNNKFSLTVPNMAPGFPYPFYPQVSTTGKVPAHILVAGDGDHTAWIMTPTDNKFTYVRDSIKEENGTVGALCFDDLDGDDWQELFVPDYDDSRIEVFKFSAKTAQLFLQ